MNDKFNNIIILEPGLYQDGDIKEFNKNGINSQKDFKHFCFFNRAIRKIGLSMKLPGADVWYGVKGNEISSYNTIIVFISALNVNLINSLVKRFPNKRIIAWYWNVVTKQTEPRLLDQKCEKGTFDLNDSLKYNMRLNTQFYFDSLTIPNKNTKYDVFCCMSDSGRYKKINEIYNFLLECNIKSKFLIVNPSANIPPEICAEQISYATILDYISESKCILEISRENQRGFTLRTLEAIFFQRKLITTNFNMIEESFYNKNNIYVFNNKNKEDFFNFLSIPFQPYSESLKHSFSCQTGLNNFCL